MHQILTRTRVHVEAMTSFSVRINTFHDAWLVIHVKYGGLYLDRGEYYRRLADRVRRYAVFLAKAFVKVKFRDRQFRKHHRVAVGRLLWSLTSWAAANGRVRSDGRHQRPDSGADVQKDLEPPVGP